MSHFAVFCPDDAGHVISIGPTAQELVRRGHQVTIVAGGAAAPLAEKLNLPFHELNSDDVPYRPSLLLGPLFFLIGQGWKIELRNIFCRRAEVVLRKAPRVLKELAIDGLIVDQTMSAAGTVAEHAGLPFVTVCSALPWNEEISVPPPFTNWDYAEDERALRRNRMGYGGWHWHIGPELKIINRYRKTWNLRPFARIDEAFSPLAQISQLCPEFDFPRRELPPQFHYIGSLAAHRQVPPDPNFPWDQLDGRPLIFASLGTIRDRRSVRVFRNILAACAGLDAQLVLALGKWKDDQDSIQGKLSPLPENALVVDFAPQLELLDKAALLVTHAGINSVLEALCRGVPMVGLPRATDQPGTASRIVHTGTGLRASYRDCTADQLRGLIQRVLSEDSFRREARRLQQAVIAAGGARRAADIAEQALTNGRPVLRQNGSAPAAQPDSVRHRATSPVAADKTQPP